MGGKAVVIALVLFRSGFGSHDEARLEERTESSVFDDTYCAWLTRTGLSRQLVATPIDQNGNYTNISSVISWTKFSKVCFFDFSLLNMT